MFIGFWFKYINDGYVDFSGVWISVFFEKVECDDISFIGDDYFSYFSNSGFLIVSGYCRENFDKYF